MGGREMALAMRFLTTASTGVVRHGPTGRSYTANSSGIVDVPVGDHHVAPVGAGQQLQFLCYVGATADRPTQLGRPGSAANFPVMYDTTLSALIFPVVSGGVVSWIGVTGAAV
jgi:hypothetical protein